MTTSPQELSGANVIDMRQLWERKVELELDTSSLLDEEEREELRKLDQFFAEESQESEPGNHGEFDEPTLVLDSHFEDYARELAEQIAPTPEVKEALETWPYRYVDWARAAEELRHDYTEVSLDGNTYLVRAF